MADNGAGQYITELEERLQALELALETDGWRLLSAQADQEFTRAGLRDIVEFCRIYYLKNPVVQRAVDVKRLYVWGQGWSVKAADEEVQAVIDSFLTDERNAGSVGSHRARQKLEIELATDGNLFLALFVDTITGRVRVRQIPFAEVEEVVTNPDDAQEPWLYKRIWSETATDLATGAVTVTSKAAYYPDWRYRPTARQASVGSTPVRWDVPVMHVRAGGFSNWRFGVPEIYDLIDWARAYKEFLEDWASIVRAYRRFAFQLTTPGGSRGVAAAKARLSTTLGTAGAETNPPPLAGSTFVAGEGVSLQPVRTAGATVGAEDGRRLLLMVAAGSGLPETFFGDASIGTLATAKSLDRPTELMMEDRQALWRDVYGHLFDFVLAWAVKAPQGALRGKGAVSVTVEDGQIVETLAWNEEGAGDVSIEFPPLVQHDIPAQVAAVVQAATLGMAGQLAGTIDLVTLSRVLLTTLGVPNVDEVLGAMFPGGKIPEPPPAPAEDEGGAEDGPPGAEEDEPGPEEEERPRAEALMVAAVTELRAALLRLQEGGASDQ